MAVRRRGFFPQGGGDENPAPQLGQGMGQAPQPPQQGGPMPQMGMPQIPPSANMSGRGPISPMNVSELLQSDEQAPEIGDGSFGMVQRMLKMMGKV